MAALAPTPETVLVVDDEPEVLSMTEDMLRGIGYNVLGTVDPHAALRLARTHSDPIHVLLTDVVMPLMGGGALSEEFWVLRPGAKVLFMSAYDVETVEAYRVRLGPGEPFLHKPFSSAELRKTIRAALLYKPPTPWPRVRR